jgi:hypothetical protein
MKKNQYEKVKREVFGIPSWTRFSEKKPLSHQVIHLKISRPNDRNIIFKEVVLEKKGFREVKNGHLVPYKRLETLGFKMLEWKPVRKETKDV